MLLIFLKLGMYGGVWGYIIKWLENSPLWVSIKHGSSSTNQCTKGVVWSWDHVYSTRHGWHHCVNLGCEHSMLIESPSLPAVITAQLFSCQSNIFLLGGRERMETEEWVNQGSMLLWYGWESQMWNYCHVWMVLIRDRSKDCSPSAFPVISLTSKNKADTGCHRWEAALHFFSLQSGVSLCCLLVYHGCS